MSARRPDWRFLVLAVYLLVQTFDTMDAHHRPWYVQVVVAIPLVAVVF